MIIGAALILISMLPSTAPASVILVTNRNELQANDLVNWAALGPADPFSGTFVGSPASLSSTGGLTITVTVPTGVFERVDQDSVGPFTGGWNGDFSPGDALIAVLLTPPLTIQFSRAVSGAGAQIDGCYGPMSATIEAFDSLGNSLGTVAQSGVTSDGADNSALFIGIRSTATNIASVQFSVSQTCDFYVFAINRLSVAAPASNAPVDLYPTSLVWNGSVGGLLCSFYTQGQPLAKATAAKMYWSTGPSFANRLSNTSFFTNDIALGWYGPNSFFIFDTHLTNAPALASYIIMVLDPENLVAETDESNNSIAVPNLQFGIDVSKVQGTINWTQVKNDLKTYALIRASKGKATFDGCNANCEFADPNFAANVQAAQNAGLRVGAYHVATITNLCTHEYYDPTNEAAFFVSVAGACLKSGNVLPALDVESNSCSGDLTSFPGIATWIDKWMREVQRLTGITPMIYCNRSTANRFDSALAQKYPLWVASYVTDPLAPADVSPWGSWALRQYSQSGLVSGIVGDVDLDAFTGSRSEFEAKLLIPASRLDISHPPQNGQLQLKAHVPGLQQVTIQASENLVSWTNISTLGTSNGEAIFIDPAGMLKARFYRLKP